MGRWASLCEFICLLPYYRSARHPEAVVGRELGGSSLLDPNLLSNLVAEEEVVSDSQQAVLICVDVKVPATQKLILGDWIAQWDTTYGAWFFYNINTGLVSRFANC